MSVRHIAQAACHHIVDDLEYGTCHALVFDALTRGATASTTTLLSVQNSTPYTLYAVNPIGNYITVKQYTSVVLTSDYTTPLRLLLATNSKNPVTFYGPGSVSYSGTNGITGFVMTMAGSVAVVVALAPITITVTNTNSLPGPLQVNIVACGVSGEIGPILPGILAYWNAPQTITYAPLSATYPFLLLNANLPNGSMTKYAPCTATPNVVVDPTRQAEYPFSGSCGGFGNFPGTLEVTTPFNIAIKTFN